MDQIKLHEAITLLNRGKFQQAKPLLEEIVASKPDNADPYRLLAQIEMMEDNLDKAIDICLEALLIEPDNENANLVMGNIFLHKQDWASAETYFMKVLSANPDNVPALNNLAAVNIKLGHQDAAINCFDSVIALMPDYLNPYYGKASVLMDQGKLNEMFDVLVIGLVKYLPRPENPVIYEETVKALYSVAGDLVKRIDVDAMIARLKKETEDKWGIEILIEEDTEMKVSAKVEFGPTHNRPYHRVLINPTKPFYGYLVMHEFMHLLMALEAGPEKNHIVLSSTNEAAEFRKKYAPQMQRLHKSMKPRDINAVIDDLHRGLVLQAMNCPLDMLVDDRLYEDYPQLRPLQFLALWNQELDNIKSSNNEDANAGIPRYITSMSRTMNLVTAKHFKRLFGIASFDDHNASRAERKLADELYDIYLEYIDDRQPGEEYDMMLDFSDALEFTQYMKAEKQSDFVNSRHNKVAYTDNISDEEIDRRRYEDLTEDEAERQRNFDRNQRADNPQRELMMAMLMEVALDDLKDWSDDAVNRLAMEIAIRGMRGITPSDTQGYSVASFPGRDFGGYEFLAYYYVTWKKAHPEDLKAIGLDVYDDAYAIAKKRFDNKYGRGGGKLLIFNIIYKQLNSSYSLIA